MTSSSHVLCSLDIPLLDLGMWFILWSYGENLV